jgi:hypothetical protein
MVRMMEVRSKIRKTPFFGTMNPEKMINRIFYLNNLSNDPSTSETTLQLQNSKPIPGRWLFNPMVTPGRIRASNLQSAKKFPNPPIRAALHLHPLERAPLAKSLRPFLRSPRATRGEKIKKWRPRDPTRRMGRGRSRSRRLGNGLTTSAPTMIS